MISPVSKGLLARNRKASGLLPPTRNQPKVTLLDFACHLFFCFQFMINLIVVANYFQIVHELYNSSTLEKGWSPAYFARLMVRNKMKNANLKLSLVCESITTI